jgi:mercuric ion transport protein
MKSLHLGKVGFVGDFVTILCCLGFGPFLSVLSAIGAGFLIDDAVLAPLLVVFLALGAIGHYASHREHRRWTPLALHALSAAGVLVFTFVVFVQPLVWAGVAGLLGASVWDVVLRRRCLATGEVRHGPGRAF